MFPDSRQRAERGGFPRPTARPVPDLSPYATKMRDSLLRADMLDYRRYNTFLKDRSTKIVEAVQKKLGFLDADFAEPA